MPTKPSATHKLPESIAREFDGEHLHVREVIQLSTVSEDGWPHSAQLSIGEILVISPTQLLIAIWSGTDSEQNLRRNGRGILAIVSDGAWYEIRGEATLAAEKQTSLLLPVFHIRIQSVREHRARYAELTSGLTFKLYEEEETLVYWRAQIAAMKAIRERISSGIPAVSG